MKKRKYYLFFLITLSVLVISTLTFFSCPPLNEEPPKNNVEFDGVLTLNVWNDLLESIYKKGISVNIDLSKCTAPASGGDVFKRTHENGHDFTENTKINQWDDYLQFNPSLGGSLGKEFILSIVLPDTATMISNASDNLNIETLEDADNDEKSRNAFRHFKRLKSVSGKRISLVGTFAFSNCTALEEANFPNLVIAMQYAFYNCKSLKAAEFEKLRHIMPSAFENCTSLKKAEFHNADRVSQSSFKGCTSLELVSFSSAMRIEPDAFRNCSSLKTARFLVDPRRSTTGHPLDTSKTVPWSIDSVAFHNDVFRGCTSLEMLDVRNAWNVYFGGGALADIGEHLEIWLYDDGGPGTTTVGGKAGRCYGHPQHDMFLGKVPGSTVPQNEDKGKLTLKTLNIVASAVVITNGKEESMIVYEDDETIDGIASIRNRINAMYNSEGDRYEEKNEPKNPVVKVTISRRPATESDLES